jgi:ribosomal protein S18 acetylase RimI-like enzyme|tara:strand:+ start:106 stop:576 length:471 start_codon:yes stop_codon:yes gene_type:complete
MNLRKANLNDKEGIANVLKESYNIESPEEGEKVFEEERAKSYNYIVAKQDEKIVGIVTWLVHGLPKHQLIELDRIAVLPEFQGKGVAKELLNSLIKEAKEFFKKHNSKLRKLYLLCHADNERAHKFYTKMGFEHETTLKEHYYKDKDEFVFSMFFD